MDDFFFCSLQIRQLFADVAVEALRKLKESIDAPNDNLLESLYERRTGMHQDPDKIGQRPMFSHTHCYGRADFSGNKCTVHIVCRRSTLTGRHCNMISPLRNTLMCIQTLEHTCCRPNTNHQSRWIVFQHPAIAHRHPAIGSRPNRSPQALQLDDLADQTPKTNNYNYNYTITYALAMLIHFYDSFSLYQTLAGRHNGCNLSYKLKLTQHSKWNAQTFSSSR